jgi:hypothetical protein
MNDIAAGLVGRAAALSFACVGVCAALPDPASARELEGSTFEQSGKLKFKFQNKAGSVMPGGGVSLPESSSIKFPAEAVVVFGPGDGLGPDDFVIPMVFSEGLLVLAGTYFTNSKGKVDGLRSARSRIKSRCKLRGVKPPQRLKFRFKASGSETPP